MNLSDAGRTEKIHKMVKVIEVFLETGLSDIEVGELTRVSSSSVQRYLTDEKTIIEMYGPKVYLEIQKKRLENKKKGLAKGGTTFAQNNIPTKQEDGKFTGSSKK